MFVYIQVFLLSKVRYRGRCVTLILIFFIYYEVILLHKVDSKGKLEIVVSDVIEKHDD